MATPAKTVSHPPGGRASAGEPSKRPEPGHEEVRSTAHPHERLERRDAPARGLAGQFEFAAVRLRHDRIGAVVLVRELRVVDPGLLHELELTPDVRVETKKVEPSFDV